MIKLKFVNEKDSKNGDYICAVCKDFLYPEETMQISCCHMYCSDCIKELGGSLYGNIECPMCTKTSRPKDIKTNNRFAYNILSSIEVYCPNEECNIKIEAGRLKSHINKCDYQKIKCNYCDNEEVLRKDYKKHLTENMEDHFIKLMQDVEELKKNNTF